MLFCISLEFEKQALVAICSLWLLVQVLGWCPICVSKLSKPSPSAQNPNVLMFVAFQISSCASFGA